MSKLLMTFFVGLVSSHMVLGLTVDEAQNVAKSLKKDSAISVEGQILVIPGHEEVFRTALMAMQKDMKAKEKGLKVAAMAESLTVANQFSVYGVWENKAAYLAHFQATHTLEFLEKVKPLIVSTSLELFTEFK